MADKVQELKDYAITKEPFYEPQGNEVEVFDVAWKNKIPVILKGPTGCGKTRFLENRAYYYNNELAKASKKGEHRTLPFVTVSCHEDLTAHDLLGRYLMDGSWMDGPALTAVKHGGILYLDEIVEARKDTTVVIHPLSDHRRTISVDKLGKVYEADENFLLVMSYNPGYQSVHKNLKPSTKQRFVHIVFTYPKKEQEVMIIMEESGLKDAKVAGALTDIASKIRNLHEERKIEEGASTRSLIYAARLIKDGISPRDACEVALVNAIADGAQAAGEIRSGIEDLVVSKFPQKR